MIDSFTAFGSSLLGPVWPVAWAVIKIVALILPLMGCVAYLTLWERKAIGWSQIRPGPNRVGPLGLLQTLADTLKRSEGLLRVSETIPREGLWRAQTPQMFRYGLLREALEQSGVVTDESGALEALGHRPLLVAADASNLKVTYPADLALAEKILLERKGA